MELEEQKPSQNVLEMLSADIEDCYNDNKASQEIQFRKQIVLKIFDNYVKSEKFASRLAKHGLVARGVSWFGSSASPLSSLFGDIDLCVWVRNCGVNGRKFDSDPVRVLLELMNELFSENLGQPRCGQPEQISAAKVPIIKAHMHGFQVDISVHFGSAHHLGTCGARLVQCYNIFNPKFTQICFFVKKWMRTVIEGNSSGVPRAEAVIPNSYTLVILIAHFMRNCGYLPLDFQVYDQYVYPDSPKPEPYEFPFPTEAIQNFHAEHRAQMDESTGETFYKFLVYYTSQLDLRNHVIYVETGHVETLEEYCTRGMQKTHVMMIVDPFDKFNPARRVKSADGFIGVLREARRRVEQARNAARTVDRLLEMQIDFRWINFGIGNNNNNNESANKKKCRSRRGKGKINTQEKTELENCEKD